MKKLTVFMPARFSRWKQGIFIFILILILFIHTSFIPNGFTWLDQNDIVEGNAVLPIQQIHRAFVIPFGQTSFYRPIVTIVNSFDSFLYHEWAPGFHLTNVLLHLTIVVLVPLFLSAFFKFSKKQLYLGALVFGIHPGSILIVGSITQRQEFLFVAFTILTLYFHKKAREEHAMTNKAFTLLCFLAALFSKETALVTVPLLVIFWEMVNRRKKDIKFFLLELMPIALYIAFRMEAVPTLWGTQTFDLTLPQHIGTRLGLFLQWLFLLISPVKPSFSDAVPILGFITFQSITVICILSLSLFIIIRLGLTSPLSKSLILILIFLSACLHIIPVPRIGSPHYIYLPALGLAGLVATLSTLLMNRFFKIIMIVWIVIASLSVFRAGFQFRDNYALFALEVEKDPYFYEGHYYLGNHYLKNRDIERAEKEFELGLVENPNVLAFRNKWTMLVNLAGIKLEKGQLEEAEQLYEKAAPDTPESMKAHLLYNTALVAYQQGKYGKVVELLSGKDLPDQQAYLLLASALKQLDQEKKPKKN